MIPPLTLDEWRMVVTSSAGVAAQQRAGRSSIAATMEFMEEINPAGAGWLRA